MQTQSLLGQLVAVELNDIVVLLHCEIEHILMQGGKSTSMHICKDT